MSVIRTTPVATLDLETLCDKTTMLYNGNSVKSQYLRIPHKVKIDIIRHAETTTNARGLVTGSRNSYVTKDGIEKLKDTVQLLHPKYDCAYHSTLTRTMQTLRFLAEEGIVWNSAHKDERLNERNLGELEGKKARHIEAFGEGDFSYAPAGGEPYSSVVDRVYAFLLDLRESCLEHKYQNILIVSHMGAIRIMVGLLKEQMDPTEVLSYSLGNSEVYRHRWSRLINPDSLNWD